MGCCTWPATTTRPTRAGWLAANCCCAHVWVPHPFRGFMRKGWETTTLGPATSAPGPDFGTWETTIFNPRQPEPPSMTTLAIVMVILLAAVELLASYITRVYSEFGKILTHEIQENLDVWEEQIEPHLGLTRDHAAICATVLQQLALGIIALEFGTVLFDHAPDLARPTYAEIAQAALGVVLVVIFCNQVLPSLLFNRTRGQWAVRLVWPIRLLLWLMTPITVFVRFFFSVASLAEEQTTPAEEAAVDVEALLEAGEEEGILEENDIDLVRSAVEFGDKLVRDVMTPRPKVFAVRDSITLEQFLEQLRLYNFSRVPVYAGTLDNVTGIAFAHDLLQISDEQARTDRKSTRLNSSHLGIS